MALTLVAQQQQTQALPIKEHSGTSAALPVQATEADQTLTNSQEISKRLAKRHSSWLETYEREMHPQHIEWANPCGGVYVDTGTQATVAPRKPVRKILRYLHNTTMDEYKTIKVETPVIDISDIKEWRLHRGTYKFLPTLKANSNNVALRRWHQHMQMYVAAFSYLRRAQMYWDQHKLQRESEISKELQKLKRNSLNILCEIEMAINQTRPMRSKGQSAKPRRAIHTITRAAMEKRLKFQTPLQHLYANRGAVGVDTVAEPRDANPIDLKFVKSHYFAFVRGMLRTLRLHTKKASGHVATQSAGGSSSSRSSSKSALLPASEHSFGISSSGNPSTNSKSNTGDATMKVRHRMKAKNSGTPSGSRAGSKPRQPC